MNLNAPVSGKSEFYKDKSSGYRFGLEVGNGQAIASSESYTSKASALNRVESVRKSTGSDVVEVTKEF